MSKIVFFDLEVNNKKITDIGAVSFSGNQFHENNKKNFYAFIRKYKFVAGHNIFAHDLKYVRIDSSQTIIDTLLWSPLLFPQKPYHKLLKDDKWAESDSNDPVNDSKKAQALFFSLVDSFNKLDNKLKSIYYELLKNSNKYHGFFIYLNFKKGVRNLTKTITSYFKDYICENANIKRFIKDSPVELAYALSIIKYTNDSILPAWVTYNYPDTINIVHHLRSTKCRSGCSYCKNNLNEVKALYDFFTYSSFKTFNNRNIQQEAVIDAINQHSLLVVFPTGGGKSLTFQLPALMAGKNEGGLTVVISPLQALMKDQIDGLKDKHSIVNAVTINSLLDPIERQKAYELLLDGSAHILYISPEMLRNKSIETVLLKRNVVRFVIDEAHCFSSWGQDFRIDYQYIGKFIKELNKVTNKSIPVSCFTATAKPQVINDIKTYFKDTLDIEFKEHIFSGGRENLSYHVILIKDDRDRDKKLVNILSASKEPTIIYTSRTRTTYDLSLKLNQYGFPSTYFHGQLERDEKIENQNKFMSGEVNIIVATNAFGMGIDKDNVKNVIHYNISSSLENYIQEAGRAARSEDIKGNCYILFNENDLNTHFNMLKQSKLSIDEIKQIWSAVKRLTGKRKTLNISPLEIAREAGWDEEAYDVETKVKTAINELERTNYLERGQNNPSVFASSLRIDGMSAANPYIEKSEALKEHREIVNTLLSRMFSIKYQNRKDPMARVELISIQLAIEKNKLIEIINGLSEVGILDDDKDIKSYIGNDSENRLSNLLKKLYNLENYLYENITQEPTTTDYRLIVERFSSEEPALRVNINQIVSLINFLVQDKYLEKCKTIRRHVYQYRWTNSIEQIIKQREQHYKIAFKILEFLFIEAEKLREKNQKEVTVNFSFRDIQDHYKATLFNESINYKLIESVLHFLTRNKILRVDGSFFVLYNAIKVVRKVEEQNIQYKKEDYKQLSQHYQHRNQQIHIMGDYAKMMLVDKNKAQEFVSDYFNLPFKAFLRKYYKDRKEELLITQTLDKYNQIFNDLSSRQAEIIKDDSKYITVFAGPGSGKTRLLVHKLGSLVLLEDVKPSQILMLTFSQAAAIEFKTRLKQLVGSLANYVEVATFHSYCFKLLEIIGNLEKSDEVVAQAVEMIKNDEVDMSKITRTMLLIDEAQDMSHDEFELVKALMEKNSDMRILAVGDSYQNIYRFRGSNSYNFESLHYTHKAKLFELIQNYRSKDNLVEFTNRFLEKYGGKIARNPIEAFDKTLGNIEVTQYRHNNLTIPIINDLISKDLKGSIAILSRTNLEALDIHTQLIKKGINAKLIQGGTRFRLYNLLELRTFLTYFGNTHTIADDEWKTAISQLKNDFKKSSLLEDCLKKLTDFKESNEPIYFSDLQQFLYQSNVEDFYQSEENEIVVSTMHQSKGKEFNHVFIYNDYTSLKEEDVPILYVAMTRAKDNLFIHSTSNLFNELKALNVKRYFNEKLYESLDELVKSLNHTEVALGWFEKIQGNIKKLYAGQDLNVVDGCLKDGNTPIVYFSKNFKDELEKKGNEGYFLSSAQVDHLVYWYNSEKNSEYLIVLPRLTLKKHDEYTEDRLDTLDDN